MSKPQETVDYKLIESSEHEDKYLIQLIKGRYSDVVYEYGNVSFHEEKKQLRIAFDYTIHETPIDIVSEELKTDPEFKNEISQILGSILSTQEFKITNGKSGPTDIK